MKIVGFFSALDKNLLTVHQGGNKMTNNANFTVDRKRNKMAARGPHIQKFVILAATLCSDNLTISWRDKLTLNSFVKSSFQVGKNNHP